MNEFEYFILKTEGRLPDRMDSFMPLPKGAPPYCRVRHNEMLAAWEAALALNPLSRTEQRAVLSRLAGLECLIDWLDCQQSESDSIEPGLGHLYAVRRNHLLAMGRKIIALDAELYTNEQRKYFNYE